MIDTFIDDIFEETSAEERPSIQASKKPTQVPTHAETSIEEELLSAAELAHSVSALHGSPHPLALIKVLGSLESNFLSDRKTKDPERYLVEGAFGIFSKLFY